MYRLSVGTTLKLCQVQFSRFVCGRGWTIVPSRSPVVGSKKKSDRSVVVLVAWQRAPPPPPGSCPKTSTSPSHVKAPECPTPTPVMLRE